MPNIEPLDNAQQPISDDQELAKVLAGVGQQGDDAAAAGTGTVVPPVEEPVVPEIELPVVPPVIEPPVAVVAPSTSSFGNDLDGVKQEALSELRPLVDKLNIPAEEKFDTYLLLLRSTDDKSLIEPAHETAKLIEDESRRAQALLNIIKEIDFLSAPKQ